MVISTLEGDRRDPHGAIGVRLMPVDVRDHGAAFARANTNGRRAARCGGLDSRKERSMFRKIASILGGFTTWTVLWLTSNAVLTAAMPRAFQDGTTDRSGLLVLLLLLSVAFSVVAGYVAALIARTDAMKAAWALAVVQLIVGIFVQAQYWSVLPIWYHLIFLGMLMPGIVVGARFRVGARRRAVA